MPRRRERLADNMLDYNPAATESLVQLMWGALLPGREGGLLNARLRYFDPGEGAPGCREDVAALVSELSDTRATVTLVNLNRIAAADGHRPGRRLRRAPIRERPCRRKNRRINAPLLTVQLEPGSGQAIVFEMKRYANAPTVKHPWQRQP